MTIHFIYLIVKKIYNSIVRHYIIIYTHFHHFYPLSPFHQAIIVTINRTHRAFHPLAYNKQHKKERPIYIYIYIYIYDSW